MTESDGVVFIGCPTHNGMLDAGAARSIYASASCERQVFGMVNGKSLLSSNCNTLWASALNARDQHRIKWFAMLHSDIEPEMWWLDKLFDIAEEVGADMLSAIVPIKDERGITSTAIGERNSNVASYRLTLSQVHHDSFPKTFDCTSAVEALALLPDDLQVSHKLHSPVLLLNTGCMICRIDKPWSDRVFFENRDWIEKHNGVWRANDFSEDWIFSKKVNLHGGKLFATSLVNVVHKGVGLFNSAKTWGIANDCGHLAEESKL